MRETRTVRTLAWIALVGIASVTAFSQDTSPWLWGPHLGATGTSAIALSWETTRSVSIDVHYAPAEVYDATGEWSETFTFDGQNGHVEIWLTELLSGTEYRYQLIAYEGDAVYPSSVGTLRIPDTEAGAFELVVYGETAAAVDRHRLIARTILQDEDPLFVGHVGELVMTPSATTYTNFLWALDPLALSHPVVCVVARDASPLYYSSLALPTGGGDSNEQWWTMTVGDVCCIGLDSTIDPDDEPITWEEQIVWLRHVLATTTADIVVVFCTDPLYSAAYAGGSNDTLQQSWEPLFAEYDVNAVFSGGTAGGYEHVYRYGVHYFATGGGGAAFESAPETPARSTVFRRYQLLHYVRVFVSDTEVRIEAVPVATELDGELLLLPSGTSVDTVVLDRSIPEE